MSDAEQAELLESIQTLLGGQEDQISIPLSALNQNIAQAVYANGQLITGVMNTILRGVNAPLTKNDNAIESVTTDLLAPLQAYQQNNEFLLTQLASAAGLTKPGDPLESALLTQSVDAPELAYSATLLIALQGAMPLLERIAVALELLSAGEGDEPEQVEEIVEKEQGMTLDFLDLPADPTEMMV
jgi:hypothetical protein